MQVQPRVDDDAGRPPQLAEQHPQPLSRIPHEPELVGEPLGVVRPALRVTVDVAQRPLPRV